MTALPKRKPARRATMAPEPEPVPEPRPVPSWDDLTAPLRHYERPVWPQAWWAASDAYRDQLAADWGPDGIKAFNDASEAAACQATYGPCVTHELAMASAPQRLPSERLFPAMMP